MKELLWIAASLCVLIVALFFSTGRVLDKCDTCGSALSVGAIGKEITWCSICNRQFLNKKPVEIDMDTSHLKHWKGE